MAKKDPDPSNNPNETAKKALEEKVDSYMDISTPEPNEADIEINDDQKDSASGELDSTNLEDGVAADGAPPLLPTDKLPDLETTKKTSKIEVIDHSEIDEVPEAKQDEPTPEPPVQEPEPEPATETEAPKPEENIEPIITDEPEQTKPPEPKDGLGLEDVGMGKAVDEIIAAEADQVLEAEDKKHEQVIPAATKTGAGQKIRHMLAGWWHNKLARNSTLAILLLALLAVAVVPTTRYAALNSFGVRASTSMTVLDDKTGQPLKNVELSLSGQTTKTDVDGYAKLEKIKLGSQNLSIKKPAFAEVNENITIGWGSNPRGDVRLTPVGTQYTFKVNDYLSGKPVSKVEAIYEEASALSNDQGEIVLTVDKTNEESLSVQIVAQDYRTETVPVPTGQKDSVSVALVPARKHAFVSKRDGTLDVYKIDVDGKNEEKVLKGTGSEREDAIALAAHPTKDIAALVSTRDGSRNKDGFTLSVLTLIDLSTNETKTLASSERVQLVDWIGDRLVFVRVAEGSSAASTTRHRLMSYDLDSATEKELASTNYFNDVVSANGSIYYTPAVYMVNGQVGLFRINADGTSKKTVFDKEVWNIFRTGYEKLSVSVGQDWYELNIANDELKKVAAAPPQLKSRVYADSPNSKQSLWTDERDGKGVLVAYGLESHEDKVIATQGGIKTPIRWLSDSHISYRVTNPQETADYVVNIDGGEPKKIRDVTNTAGIDRWYYY